MEYFTEPQVCGRNATTTGHTTDTATVVAGSQIGFRVATYDTKDEASAVSTIRFIRGEESGQRNKTR